MERVKLIGLGEKADKKAVKNICKFISRPVIRIALPLFEWTKSHTAFWKGRKALCSLHEWPTKSKNIKAFF